MDEDAVKKLYPLHYFVFKCDHDGLKSELASKTESDIKECINAHDIHLNTPVMLATILGHVECAEALLDSGADANVQNKGDLNYINNK
jgi:ankyrin repeat protein